MVRMLGLRARRKRRNLPPWSAPCGARALPGSDIGNVDRAGRQVEHDDSKYTESEMQEFAQASAPRGSKRESRSAWRARRRAMDISCCPKPSEMAEYCHQRLGRLKNDKQREFVADMYRDHAARQELVAGAAGISGEYLHSNRWEDLMSNSIAIRRSEAGASELGDRP